ncbi:MAG: glycosyltransferase family 2 protein [Candidatus Hodarchaeota archaeon]
MKTITPLSETYENSTKDRQANKPFVSTVVPAYNEARIIKQNLARLCNYMESLEDEYRWELIVVNDGSTDETGELAEDFAKTRQNIHILHHTFNFKLGQALRYAFKHCKGDYVITMDLDLSYSPDHIDGLLKKIRNTKAKIVIASPYMKGGKISNVPWMRRILSVWANRFLSLTAKGRLTTLTGMVRAYDRRFLNSLNLKAMDYEINPEIIYKAQLLRARIVEMPAHLDWSFHKGASKPRRSSMRILRGIMSCLFSGFIFRPFMFFILPGIILTLISLYPLAWALIHTFEKLIDLPASNQYFDAGLSAAVRAAFNQSPHSFLVGGITLLVALQLISLGLLALQNKRYFEEIFHLGTTIFKSNQELRESR